MAGIIVTAVSDELVLAHPGGHIDFKTAATTIVGPALFLVGNLVFKRLLAGSRGLSHMVGMGLLVLAAPAALIVPPLALGAITSAILVIVAIWETRSLGGYAPRQPGTKRWWLRVNPRAGPKTQAQVSRHSLPRRRLTGPRDNCLRRPSR